MGYCHPQSVCSRLMCLMRQDVPRGRTALCPSWNIAAGIDSSRIGCVRGCSTWNIDILCLFADDGCILRARMFLVERLVCVPRGTSCKFCLVVPATGCFTWDVCAAFHEEHCAQVYSLKDRARLVIFLVERFHPLPVRSRGDVS